MWVIFNDYVLVVDANFPWGAREILPRIRATTNKPIRFVLNTHYHGDHAYGNAIFVDAGAMIVSSEALTRRQEPAEPMAGPNGTTRRTASKTRGRSLLR
jgi:glyoxylase-like metal-dependent hydrolase (beta-lactamase superfamily II)